MNCKPNEMATVVRDAMGDIRIPRDLVGLTVQVVELVPDLPYPQWLLKHPLRWVADCFGSGLDNSFIPGDLVLIESLPDCLLQPWRGLEQHGERAEPISLMQPRGKSIFQQMRDALDMSELSRAIDGLNTRNE